MKIVAVLLLALAVSQAAEVKASSRSTQKTEDEPKNEKREAKEGNSGLYKRTPAVSVTPTPGIEYADSTRKETPQDKAPSQQIYATPVPPPAPKISDVVTQGVPLPHAIATHLFSPVSVYQARLGSPTQYEVSAPVASQLAYSEHKVYQPAPQNSIQFFNPSQKLQQNGPEKPNNFARFVTFNHQQPQQIFLQPQPQPQTQPILYTQQQIQGPQQPQPQPQQFIQYAIPQIPYAPQPQQILFSQPPQPQIQFIQQPQPQVTYTQSQVQQPGVYPQNPQASYAQTQVQQPQVYQQQPEPQVLQFLQPQPEQFARQQNAQQQAPSVPPQRQQELQANALFVRIQQETANVEAQRPQPAQRELKNLQTPQTKTLEKAKFGQQNFNEKGQGGAVSYASFSQSQPSQNYVHPSIQYNTKLEPVQNAPQQNKQQQIQIQHYEQQQRNQQQNYQQQHYQQHQANQQQAYQQQNYQQANQQQINHQQQQQRSQQYHQQEIQVQQQQMVYLKPQQQLLAAPGVQYQAAPQPALQYQPAGPPQPLYPAPVLLQGGFLPPAPQPLAAAPTYAPVQYFGKFAQNIFGGYQPQR
ncbi:hypothetical protein JYU34_013926 [Plutella xylostella]|uniref:Uncharacterized protein n=1 Tax=Plutella xylostella TaxID=51655 RepID=A0ABQ7QAX6_PLUXY|nr:hypothetical protein JYU34_013926 [Plutella xylostella]